MSENLIFMMGEFEAEFPSDRKYCANHMWAIEIDSKVRFGFTAYAVRLLQDVYFLDWLLDAPAAIKHQQEMGSIESKKAESSLYAPVTGNLVQFNEELMEDPSAINTDKYDGGWLFEVENADGPLLTPSEYLDSLVDAWKKTERTIKGQVNQSD
jgi:glycine cleavage system H protein